MAFLPASPKDALIIAGLSLGQLPNGLLALRHPYFLTRLGGFDNVLLVAVEVDPTGQAEEDESKSVHGSMIRFHPLSSEDFRFSAPQMTEWNGWIHINFLRKCELLDIAACKSHAHRVRSSGVSLSPLPSGLTRSVSQQEPRRTGGCLASPKEIA